MLSDNAMGCDAWRQAKTLQDLGELVAHLMEGTLDYCPFSGGLDPETDPLRGILAAFNRKGFVTIVSQPGLSEPGKTRIEGGFAQRACVQGYAQEEVAKRLAALTLYTDLLVMIFEPGRTGGYRVPVTTDEFHPFTWFGGCWGEEIDPLVDVLSAEAFQALTEAWNVTIIYLQWGRETYLWEHVSRVLNDHQEASNPFSITPHPDLELDTDFVS